MSLMALCAIIYLIVLLIYRGWQVGRCSIAATVAHSLKPSSYLETRIVEGLSTFGDVLCVAGGGEYWSESFFVTRLGTPWHPWQRLLHYCCTDCCLHQTVALAVALADSFALTVPPTVALTAAVSELVWSDLHSNSRTHTRMHTRTHAHPHVHARAHAHARMHTHTHSLVRTHARTHTRTHAHTHTRTHALALAYTNVRTAEVCGDGHVQLLIVSSGRAVDPLGRGPAPPRPAPPYKSQLHACLRACVHHDAGRDGG